MIRSPLIAGYWAVGHLSSSKRQLQAQLLQDLADILLQRTWLHMHLTPFAVPSSRHSRSTQADERKHLKRIEAAYEDRKEQLEADIKILEEGCTCVMSYLLFQLLQLSGALDPKSCPGSC